MLRALVPKGASLRARADRVSRETGLPAFFAKEHGRRPADSGSGCRSGDFETPGAAGGALGVPMALAKKEHMNSRGRIMQDFFDVKSVAEARRILVSAWGGSDPPSLGREDLGLLDALGRVLALDVTAPEDVPAHARSTVDGYAVIAQDTFGASESQPAFLQLVEEIATGSAPRKPLRRGQVSAIPTGGVLPRGADACVMLEHTDRMDEHTVLVQKTAAPGENVVQPGEDVRRDETLLLAGRSLTPYDLGALAALGLTSVAVVRRPRVAVISTGDEVVPPSVSPAPGEVRDINTYTLASALLTHGAQPVMLGIARDEHSALRSAVERGLELADAVVVSGGSSVGTRDNSARVIRDLGPPGVLVHGVAVKPGKPVILAVCKRKPVFGLPGHPVSALVALDLFVRHALSAMLARALDGLCADAPCRRTDEILESEGARAGARRGGGVADGIPVGGSPRDGSVSSWGTIGGAALHEVLSRDTWVTARLTRNVASAPGREDHVRVSLILRDGEAFAEPILGKSGLISTMIRSHGEIVIEPEQEGLLEGSVVRVRVARAYGRA